MQTGAWVEENAKKETYARFDDSRLNRSGVIKIEKLSWLRIDMIRQGDQQANFGKSG